MAAAMRNQNSKYYACSYSCIIDSKQHCFIASFMVHVAYYILASYMHGPPQPFMYRPMNRFSYIHIYTIKKKEVAIRCSVRLRYIKAIFLS